MAKIKVTIDRDQCISCESCWTICPEFFAQSAGDSWSEITPKYRLGGDPAQGEAPDELRDKVKEAADSCPVQIIHAG